MANDSMRSSVLAALIQDAGIPIDGISISDINADPPVVSIQYGVNATPEQIALGDQILSEFDWRRRRPLARNAIVTALQNLTIAQRNAIQMHMMAEWLRDNPEKAAKIGVFLGTPIPVDEVDPT